MIEACLAFLFGLLIGSFLNVCIYRLPRDLSVVRPRSYCTACERTIAWYDNVPLLSYLLLKGRCRYCGAAISARYPVVELLTGALFFGYVLLWGATPAAAKMCLLGALLVGLIFADLEERILPDEFTLGGLAAGLILAAVVPVDDVLAHALLWAFDIHPPLRWGSVAESVFGAALPALFLWGLGKLYLRLRHREGLGLGDVKLMAMIGAFLGLRGALVTLIVGSILGSVVGSLYIALMRKDPSTYELPFGTFLGIGAIVASLIGPALTGWYSGFY